MAAPEAPLLAGPPPGLRARFLTAGDGVTLRAAFADARGARRGRLVLCHGRSEFIEKYYPVVERLTGLGLDLCTFDWRGQGLSDRLLPDRLPGYVRDFDAYRHDLDAALTAFEAESSDDLPLLVLGHSMGGCIALRELADRPKRFDAAILCAPMVDLELPPTLRLVAPGVARSLVRMGWGRRYVSTCEDCSVAEYPFEDNVLSHDEAQFARYVGLVRVHPELGLGGATWSWLAAAFREMQALAATPDGSIASPALMLLAEEDAVVSNAAAEALAARNPALRVERLEASRHEPFIETEPVRAALWSHIEAFLDTVLSDIANPIANIAGGTHGRS